MPVPDLRREVAESDGRAGDPIALADVRRWWAVARACASALSCSTAGRKNPALEGLGSGWEGWPMIRALLIGVASALLAALAPCQALAENPAGDWIGRLGPDALRISTTPYAESDVAKQVSG